MKKHGKCLVIVVIIAVLCLLTVKGTVPLTVPLTVGGTGGKVSCPSASALASVPSTGSSSLMLRCNYYNEKDFMNSVIAAMPYQTTVNHFESENGQSETEVASKSGSIAGGIVPHHLLAGKMIAEFFQTVSQSSPNTLVVIAPNHKRTGLNGLHTSIQNWGTAFGVLEVDPVLTGKLISDLKASQNTSLMEDEHSISSLVPYIKYYLPNAKIVPVLLHGNYTAKASQELGEYLAEALLDHPRAAIIASVDFSHYLDTDTADKMDEETLAAIKSKDITVISKMGNDNLDSPPSIVALLSAMEKIGATDPEVLAHGNSSDITGSGADYTTSYYTMLFRR